MKNAIDEETRQLLYWLFWIEGAFGVFVVLLGIRVEEFDIAIAGGVLAAVAAAITTAIDAQRRKNP